MKARQWMLVALAAVLAVGCGRGDAPDVVEPETGSEVEQEGSAAVAVAEPPAEPPALEDVMERDPRYIVGISYPPEARGYPGLAVEMDAYTRAARADLDEAVASLGQGRPRAPYDLALHFEMLAETPRVVAVAAEGSCYTGGAHGNPLVARFVWLPQRDEMLTAENLMADEEGWRAVSGYVREQLHLALSDRADAGGFEPEERSRFVRTTGQMIDQGSTPDPANFSHFEPVMGAGGAIEALRFVFPPYQVGPYSDGTQKVVVPASVLLPHVADGYRGLFSAG